MPDEPPPGKLLTLAVEGVVPVLAGCAGALAGGPEAGMVGGMIGVAVGQSVEKVINIFGGRIVQRWAEWFRRQPPADRDRALTELAALTPEEARRQTEDLLDALAFEPLPPADRELVLDYLSLIPGSLDRALSRPAPGGARTLPPTISAEEPQQLLALLPITLPPYPVGCEVPGTPYRLESLLGTGGFGAVYRASTRSLQHLPLAIKFCLDPGLAQALHRERENLERLMKAGGEDWSPRIVRLYGYDLEHKTPYLVYEFVTGGDLIRHLSSRREKTGRALDAQEVFAVITQVTEALAFAHANGLVHRDLKPANVLVEGGLVKLADFGLGGISAARAAQVSRIGATTVDLLSLADQASLFRGAGTPLYMAPEQRRGLPPDPRHDLFSLGVMWYQLLLGDVSRELHPGWAKELAVRFAVPRSHINLIDACVGWYDERPQNAGELLRMMQEAAQPQKAVVASEPAVAVPPPPLPAPPPDGTASEVMRQALLANLVKKLVLAHRDRFEIGQRKGALFGPAAFVAFIAYSITASERAPTFAALFVAVVLAGITAAISALVLLGRRSEVNVRVTTLMATLEREFPAAVAGWGGPLVLRDAKLVEEIARKMGIDIDPSPTSPPPMRAPSVVPVHLDPPRREAAVEQLREMNGQQARLAGYGVRKPLPWPLAVAVGLLLGVAAGAGLGAYLYQYFSPQSYNDYGVVTHYDHAGRILTESGLVQAKRFADMVAPVGGVGAGILVAGLVAFVLARLTWYRRPLLGGLVLGLVVGNFAGSGLGALVHHLLSPYTIDQTGAATYYRHNGSTIIRSAYERERTELMANSVLAGVCAAVGIALLIVLCVQLWYRRRARAAERAVEEQARGLARAFPELAAAGGGVEGLSRPGSARQLLLGLGEGV